MENKSFFFNTSDFKIQSKDPHGNVYFVEKNRQKWNKFVAKTINIKDTFEGNEKMIFLQESEKLFKLIHPAIVKYDGVNLLSLENPKLFNPIKTTDYFPMKI